MILMTRMVGFSAIAMPRLTLICSADEACENGTPPKVTPVGA